MLLIAFNKEHKLTVLNIGESAAGLGYEVNSPAPRPHNLADPIVLQLSVVGEDTV